MGLADASHIISNEMHREKTSTASSRLMGLTAFLTAPTVIAPILGFLINLSLSYNSHSTGSARNTIPTLAIRLKKEI